MNISEGLKSLIESSQIDGKLSSKEREVIINKAENEGHNRDEFEIYLDGQFQLIESESVFKIFFKWIWQKKDRRGAFFIVAAFLAFLGFRILTYYVIPSTSNFLTKVERGCDDMDDCIAKYKFDEATLYVNENPWDYEGPDDKRKIRKANVNYFLLNTANEQAYMLMADYHFESSFPTSDYWLDAYNVEVEWFNQVVESIIIESENNQELLRKLILMLKPLAKKDIKASRRDKKKDHYIADDSRKKELLKKYKLD